MHVVHVTQSILIAVHHHGIIQGPPENFIFRNSFNRQNYWFVTKIIPYCYGNLCCQFSKEEYNISYIFGLKSTNSKGIIQGIETRLNAYGPLYVEKQPKYWLNLAESFIKAQNATTGAPMFWFLVQRKSNKFKSKHLKVLTHKMLIGQGSRSQV